MTGVLHYLRASVSMLLAGLLALLPAVPAQTPQQPAHIRFDETTRTVWGDATTGKVIDWTYVSNDKILQLVFGMGPGESHR